MSQFTAIRAASRTLQTLLRAGITNSPDPQLQGVDVDLRSPRELRPAPGNTAANAVSLWLYRIARNADFLNAPGPRSDGAIGPSIPLDLFYLVAPITTVPDNEQALLGRVIQVLGEHSTLSGPLLQDELAGEPAQLKVSLETISLEELTRIWTALDESYQLSVSYRVELVEIDAGQPVQGPPVHVRRAGFGQREGEQ